MAKAEKVTRKVVDLHAATRAAEVKGGRSIQAKSNIASTHNKTADALVANIRG
jgi:hypothetical protein